MSTFLNLESTSENFEQEVNLQLQELGVHLSELSLKEVCRSVNTSEDAINYCFENLDSLETNENNNFIENKTENGSRDENSAVDDVVETELIHLSETNEELVEFELDDDVTSIFSILSQNPTVEAVTIICLDSLLSLTDDAKFEDNRITLMQDIFLSKILDSISDSNLPNTIKSKYLRLLWYLSRSETCSQYPIAELIIVKVVAVLKDNIVTEEAKECSVAVLANLSLLVDHNRHIIAKAGAIPLLIELLNQNNKRLKELVLVAFKNLSNNRTVSSNLIYSGILVNIFEIINSGSETSDISKERAVAILLNIVVNSEGQKSILFESSISAIISLMKNGSPKSIRDALVILSQFIQVDEMMTDISTNDKLLYAVFNVFKNYNDNQPLLEEAMKIIVSLCAHDACKKVMISLGTLPTLLQILQNYSNTTMTDTTNNFNNNNILLEQVLEAMLQLLTHGSLFDYLPLHSTATFPKLLLLLQTVTVAVEVKIKVLTIFSNACDGIRIRSTSGTQHDAVIFSELSDFSKVLVYTLSQAIKLLTQTHSETATVTTNKLFVESILTAMIALTSHPSSLTRLRDAGLILLLIRLMSSCDHDKWKQQIANVLYNFCADATCLTLIADEDNTVNNLIDLLSNESNETKVFACAILFQFSTEMRYVIAMKEANVVPVLVQLLATGSHYLQTYSSGILARLAAVGDEYRYYIGQSGAIPLLVQLHASSGASATDADNVNAKNYTVDAIWELSIAAENQPVLFAAKAEAALLVTFCDDTITEMDIKSKVTGALANLIKNRSGIYNDSNLNSNFIPSLLKMLSYEGDSKLCTSNSVLLVRYLIENSQSFVKKFIDGGIVQLLAHILRVSTGTTKINTIITLGQLAAFENSYRQLISKAGVLPLLSDALVTQRTAINSNNRNNGNIPSEKEKTVLTIRNLSLDSFSAKLLAECSTIQNLLLLLTQWPKMSSKTVERITMALVHLATHSPSHWIDFITANGIPELVKLLSVTTSTSIIYANIIELLHMFLSTNKETSSKEDNETKRKLFEIVGKAVLLHASMSFLINQLADDSNDSAFSSYKMQVLELLITLATDLLIRDSLRTEGVIACISNFILKGNDAILRELCYDALLLFINDDKSDDITVIVSSGMISSVVESLRNDTSTCKIKATQILCCVMLFDVTWVGSERSLFSSLALLLGSANIEENENAIAVLRGLSMTTQFCDQIIKSDNQMLKFLGRLLIPDKSLACSEDAVIVLSQLLESNAENRQILATSDCIISGIISFIRDSYKNSMLTSNCLESLEKLTGEPEARSKVTKVDTISLLCNIMESQATGSTFQIIEICLGILVNLTSTHSETYKRCLTTYCSLLVSFLTSESQIISERAMVLLLYLSDFGENCLKNTSTLPVNLVQLLSRGTQEAILNDLKLLFKLTSGGENAAMIFLVSDSTITKLTSLLTHENSNITEELLGVISNLMIKQDNRLKFTKAKLVPTLAGILTTGSTRAQWYLILILIDICKGKSQDNDSNRIAVVNAGMLAVLVERLRSRRLTEVKMLQQVKELLCVLAKNDTVRREMKHLGVTKDIIGYSNII